MFVATATSLPDGPRLRVRLVHTSERAGLEALLARLGVAADELDLARALRFDPRSRTVACVTAWIGGAELLVGLGAMDAVAKAPDLLLADEARAPGTGGLLGAVLRERSSRQLAA